MTLSLVSELAEDSVFALHNTFALDGRVSAYPDSARGHTVSNCYLLKEDTGAFLLDTGYAAHEGRILDQLGGLLDPETPLSLVPMRINEFMSVGNGMAIAGRFNVVECYSPQPNAADWLDFSAVNGGGARRDIPTILLRGVQTFHVGAGEGRPIEALSAPLRLINTTWIYDPASRILFSSDMFPHVSQDEESGPWVLDDDDGVTTHAFIRSFLLNTRYWWLEGARTDGLRAGIADVFERCDIETIAPAYGAVLRGRAQVERQFRILDEVLRDLDQSQVEPAYVPRGLER